MDTAWPVAKTFLALCDPDHAAPHIENLAIRTEAIALGIVYTPMLARRVSKVKLFYEQGSTDPNLMKMSGTTTGYRWRSTTAFPDLLRYDYRSEYANGNVRVYLMISGSAV